MRRAPPYPSSIPGIARNIKKTARTLVYHPRVLSDRALLQVLRSIRPTEGAAPWESYVTDPGEVPDVKDWRTEVYWPLAK